jgi:hypothetical protein
VPVRNAHAHFERGDAGGQGVRIQLWNPFFFHGVDCW